VAVRILNCDVMEGLRQLPDESVHCVITSPPYWGLRSYLKDDHPLKPFEIGSEPTLQEHIAKLVEVFRDVRRVLRKDGTLWLNYGDAYAGSWGAQSRGEAPGPASKLSGGQVYAAPKNTHTGSMKRTPGLKPKDLMGLPWRLAFALQDDGWWLRSDIIWAKPNPMPESVTDRPTKAHEYIFLLTKSERYHYDAEAIREMRTSDEDADGFRGGSYVGGEPGRRTVTGNKRIKVPGGWDRGEGGHGTIHRAGRTSAEYQEAEVKHGRNKRSVWTIATVPFTEAHYATFPPELPEICIKAGCPRGGTVLDPFGGSGTTGMVADLLQRNAILIDLNPDNKPMAERRIAGTRTEMLDLMEAAE
jgi:DNA modification methylase